MHAILRIELNNGKDMQLWYSCFIDSQEHLSTSRVLSSEISAKDASSDGVFLNELLHKGNSWKMLFLSCDFTFSFTNYIERQASSRTVAILSYVSIPLLTRSPLCWMLSSSTWQTQFRQQGLCKALSNHFLSPLQEDLKFPQHVLHTSITSLPSYSSTSSQGPHMHQPLF